MKDNNTPPNSDLMPPYEGSAHDGMLKPWYPALENPAPPAIPNQPPQNTGLTTEQTQTINDCIKKSTQTIQAATPNYDSSKHSRKVTADNIHTIQYVAEYAAEHPHTVNPTLDVAEWLADLQEANQIFTIEQSAETLEAAISDYKYAIAILAFDDFRKYYQCIKILVADGLEEAKAIYPTMKQVYGKLFGKTGPRECPVAEINNAVTAANAVLTKNRGVLSKVLENEKLLTANLSHEIHSED